MPAAARPLRLLAVALLAGVHSASGAEALDHALIAGMSLSGEHTTSDGIRYRVAVEAGRTAEFSLRQQRGATEVRVDDGAGHSFALQIEAGRQARLELPLVGAGQAWLITVLPRRAGGTAEYDVTLGPLRAATPSDSTRVTAFAAYVEAERLRRTNIREGALVARDAAAIETARARYQLAIAQGAAANDACGVRRARIGLSRLEVGMGNYAVGREQARAALSAACNDDFAEQAQAAKTEAMAAAYQGDFAASAEAHESALALYRRSGDRLYEDV